jgi:hypothetical protein
MTHLIVSVLSWVNSGSNHDSPNSHCPLLGKQSSHDQLNSLAGLMDQTGAKLVRVQSGFLLQSDGEAC